MRRSKKFSRSSGQSLIETALILPVLLCVLLNALNFGYYYFIALNITAAPRTGILYSIVGPNSPGATAYPPACTVPTGTPASTAVYYLAQQDLSQMTNSAANATIQVCSSYLGTNGSSTSQKANCVTYTPGSGAGSGCGTIGTGATGEVPDADPEAPTFVLQRVDVGYTFSPLIPGTPFNLTLLSVCNAGGTSCTFHRFAEMRGM